MDVNDLPAVFDVRLSTIENAITIHELEEEYEVTPESLSQAMRSSVKGWLCEKSGNIIGFSMGNSSNGEVQVIVVRPEFEGKGIGKTLLGYTQKWLFSSGYDEIWLRSNPDQTVRAHGFYRKLGWQSTGEMIGEDEVLILSNTNT